MNYVGNIGRFLNGTRNINIPEPAAGGIQARRPFPTYGNINYFDDSLETTYHSLQASIEQRTHNGLFYLASYTWSKSLQHAERHGRRRQQRPREGAVRLRRAAQRRHQRRLRAAGRPRAALPGQRAGDRRRHPRRLADPGHLHLAQRATLHARRSASTAPTPASARQRPNRLGSGSSTTRPSTRGSTRRPSPSRPSSPTATRAAASCARTATRRSTSRCSSSSASAPHRLVFRARGLQPDQHAQLQRAQHRDRHGRRRPRHQHGERAASDAVRLEIRFLTMDRPTERVFPRRRIGQRRPARGRDHQHQRLAGARRAGRRGSANRRSAPATPPATARRSASRRRCAAWSPASSPKARRCRCRADQQVVVRSRHAHVVASASRGVQHVPAGWGERARALERHTFPR